MRLIGNDGHGVELRVVGYQFPNAVDPQQRQSWLVIEGSASCPHGTWSFRWQALTAQDAVELMQWLQRSTAQSANDGHSHNDRLDFTEPNLALAYTRTDSGHLEFRISLDLEFSPPWRPRARSGDPYVVTCQLTPESALKAATDWTAEVKPYPPASNDNP